MGRKKMDKAGTFDRLGEAVDLEKCPLCTAHPDCFSNIEGYCTALKECEGDACVFYKKTEVAIEQCKAAYRKLKEEGRTDLILKYQKTLTALGAFDDEIDVSDTIVAEMKAYEERNYKKQFEELSKEAAEYSEAADSTEGGEDI